MSAAASRHRPPSSSPRSRLVWLDVARGLALLSMFVAHVAPASGPAGVLNLSEFLTAALFAALVGASVDLEADRYGWGRALGAALVRAVVLVGCGWLGGLFEAQVVGILGQLAVVTIVAVLCCRLPSAVLAGLALLLAGAGVWVTRLGAAPVLEAVTSLTPAGADPATAAPAALSWLVFGPYRVLLLCAYALAGTVLARTLQRSSRGAALGWAVGGAAVGAVAVYASRLQTGEAPLPYTGTVTEVVLCLGLVGAALGLAAALTPDRVPWLTDVLAVPGSMTLSVYLAHLAYLGWGRTALSAIAGTDGPWVGAFGRDDAWFNLVVLCVGGILLPLLWRALVRVEPWRRGPLEGPVRLLTRPIHGR